MRLGLPVCASFLWLHMNPQDQSPPQDVSSISSLLSNHRTSFVIAPPSKLLLSCLWFSFHVVIRQPTVNYLTKKDKLKIEGASEVGVVGMGYGGRAWTWRGRLGEDNVLEEVER